jgi:aminoglycoside phosphotransferase (APT) family kinase protein
MHLPEHTPLTAEIVRAIGARHGLPVAGFAPLPQVGIINAIYLLNDELVLRVPRNHPGHVNQARIEGIAAPAARAAGVRTPALVAFDDACDLLPVPYSIMERIHGETLGLLERDPADTPQAWRELGRDLALLHTGVRKDGLAGQLKTGGPGPDPRELAEARAADGWFTALEVRWLTAWLDRLAPAATVPITPRCVHRDVQATNIMVQSGSLDYLVLLDWGCTGWGDPAWDFFGMPLRAVPFILEGHRSVAPLDCDEGAEARILWRHLQFSLDVLPRGAAPGLSWGERPLPGLLEFMRFFQEAPGGRWHDLRP